MSKPPYGWEGDDLDRFMCDRCGMRKNDSRDKYCPACAAEEKAKSLEKQLIAMARDNDAYFEMQAKQQAEITRLRSERDDAAREASEVRKESSTAFLAGRGSRVAELAKQQVEIERLQAMLDERTLQHGVQLQNAIDLTLRCEKLESELVVAREVLGVADVALLLVQGWARLTREYWDQDNDSKVGKHLAALAGDLPGYAPDTDGIHAYWKQVKAARAAGGGA